MTEFKYSLDKSSKKFICPNCSKRRFVRYLNQSTSEYLDHTYGRCDRETNCGYHKSPTQNETIANVNYKVENVIPDFISPSLVTQSLKKYDCNNFVKFLKKHFTNDEVENCITTYKIGTSKHWDGATVFWQIDQSQIVHTGKIILFDESTGKRVKTPFAHINWVHRKINKPDFKLNQCLYGLHLLNQMIAITTLNNSETESPGYPQNITVNEKPVINDGISASAINSYNASNSRTACNQLQTTIALVESEKTAIIMSLFIPEYIWMATGSKQNLKLQLLEPIKKENIVVYPDKGEFADWNKKVIELQKIGFKIRCSSIVENSEFETGTDLADIYFAIKKDSANIKIVLSETEKTIQRLSKINPSILSLIETFDLIDENGNGIRIV